MTDRTHSLTVVLDRELRSDDAEGICNAIRQLRGVALVTQNIPANVDFYAARNQARLELVRKLYEVLSLDESHT